RSNREVLDFMGNKKINKLTNKPEIETVNDLYENIKFIQNAVGAVPGPMDCWLTIMGIKTLSLRMKKQEENAKEIVTFLNNHPKIKKVNYPGLPSHINHEVAKQQMSGYGAMISFELKGGVQEGIKLMNNLQLWSLAESLGAVESMVTHPASMTHAAVPRDVRQSRGISDGLVRLSVGIENAFDLINDLQQALDLI
ncbi:MAG: trans-sulfuration enzyme family protein, partial [Candidatus Thorarchaeota archaeon]